MIVDTLWVVAKTSYFTWFRCLSPLSVVPYITFTGLGVYRLGFPTVKSSWSIPHSFLILLLPHFLAPNPLKTILKYGNSWSKHWFMNSFIILIWCFVLWQSCFGYSLPLNLIGSAFTIHLSFPFLLVGQMCWTRASRVDRHGFHCTGKYWSIIISYYLCLPQIMNSVWYRMRVVSVSFLIAIGNVIHD